MCGIAGILDSRISSESLEAKGKLMMDSLVHRGPDAGGLWRSEACNLVLLHRRLSIQDLSASANQPMHSVSKRYCVVFNGEIYNFRELAADLKENGHMFIGHSDTEVLLASIEKWGLAEAVKRFIGMFAFALWDREEKTLHLCRDRMGEKPLYYGWINKAFYFSSELKAIEAAAPNGELEIDESVLPGYLRYGYISAPHSIYSGIFKLPPGTFLSLRTCGKQDVAQHSPWPDTPPFSPETYWSVLDVANLGLSNLILDERDALEELDQLLRRTIKRQMIADVELGMFLSGGIDSSVVSAIAQQEASNNVRTYTIGFSERDFDESGYANDIASHLGTEHLTMHVTPNDALQVVPKLSTIYDEPFADSSQIPAYLVAKLAREHVTVCLSGDGGDELFAGYNRYLWAENIWRKLSIIPRPLRNIMGKALSIPSPGIWDRLYRVAHTLLANKKAPHKLVGLKLQKLAGFMQQDDIEQGYDYLLSYWHNPKQLLVSNLDCADTKREVLPGTNDFISLAMYLDQVAYLPGDNLAKVDRASMAVSLETRLPLLSHEIVELSWRLPPRMKIQNSTTKIALRQVLYRYVPRELVDRPKMGFSVPIDQWLRGELKEWAEDLLGTINSSGKGLIMENPVRQAWNEHINGLQDHSHRLWTVLMFLSWAQSRT